MKKNSDYAVLLHGFWRSARSMKKLAQKLTKSGFIVININYPSSKFPIEELVNKHIKPQILSSCTDPSKKIHFITHSMGGLLVRYLLAKNKIPNLAKVVMLAPPNQGSKLADFFSKFQITKTILGPAISQMHTTTGITKQLPKPDYPIGIIAGKYDAKVPIKNSQITNMSDFLIVPKTHAFIMNSPKVFTAIINFLEHQKFNSPNNV